MIRSLCFAALVQTPRCRMGLIKGNPIVQPVPHASIWFDNFHRVGSRLGRFSSKALGNNTNRQPRERLGPVELWANETKRLSEISKQQQTRTEKYVRKDIIQVGEPDTIKHVKRFDGVNSTRAETVVNKSELNKFEVIKYHDVERNIDDRFIQRPATFFVFDLETTGIRRDTEKIIEFALRDLSGGENSTFETLVNPECEVPNQEIHGISTQMVNRPNVPRFKEVIPIVLRYVKMRQIPGKPVVFIGHNCRVFDVPFLISEFSRCSIEIPSDWEFLDTLRLARELAKLEGTENLSGKKLEDLRKYYDFPLVGKAHRAMSDVNVLAKILKEMTYDLKLPVSGLLERTFKASDIKKKKK